MPSVPKTPRNFYSSVMVADIEGVLEDLKDADLSDVDALYRMAGKIGTLSSASFLLYSPVTMRHLEDARSAIGFTAYAKEKFSIVPPEYHKILDPFGFSRMGDENLRSYASTSLKAALAELKLI